MLTHGTRRRDDHRPRFVGVLLDDVEPNPARGAKDEYNLVPPQLAQPYFLLLHVDPAALAIGDALRRSNNAFQGNHVEWKERAKTRQRENDEERNKQRRGRYGDGGE